MKTWHKSLLIILGVLVIDQALKFWVKTHMFLGEEIPILDGFFKLHFIENEGMAFGMSWGPDKGKLALTLFRLIAVVFIAYLLHRAIKAGKPFGLILSLSLIFAGALGNIIDSVFYGVLFSASEWGSYKPAVFLPPEGGYAPLFHGKVVDMLFFPLIEGRYPEWVPFIGGRDFLFFRPVFNIADSAISIGVFIILIFQKRFFGQKDQKKEEKSNETEEELHLPFQDS